MVVQSVLRTATRPLTSSNDGVGASAARRAKSFPPLFVSFHDVLRETSERPLVIKAYRVPERRAELADAAPHRAHWTQPRGNIAALMADRGGAEAKTAGRSRETSKFVLHGSSLSSTPAAPLHAMLPSCAPRLHPFTPSESRRSSRKFTASLIQTQPSRKKRRPSGATCALILPVQSKGVVELDVRVRHGLEGGKLLQRLHQLHDGLVILNGQEETSP